MIDRDFLLAEADAHTAFRAAVDGAAGTERGRAAMVVAAAYMQASCAAMDGAALGGIGPSEWANVGAMIARWRADALATVRAITTNERN